MNKTNKTLSETISEHLTESSEAYKQNELPPVELKATIPGLIDQKIELAHLYREFRLSEQRVSNGTLNEMEPGARYIRDLNVRKIAIIREKFDSKFKDLLGVEDISELNDLDEAFAVLEEAGAANKEEVDQIDETNMRFDPEAAARPKSSDVKNFLNRDKNARAGAASKKYIRRMTKLGGLGPNQTKKDTEAHMKAQFEEVEQIGEAFVIHKGKHAAGETSSLAGQTHYGVEIKDVYADKKEAQAHADKLNKGRGYKPEDEKNPLYGGVLYQVSPKNTKRVPGVPLNAMFKINEKAPPGMEDWIKGRKEDFKERYGDRWEEVLYRTAWKMYNKKEEVEQIDEAKNPYGLYSDHPSFEKAHDAIHKAVTSADVRGTNRAMEKYSYVGALDVKARNSIYPKLKTAAKAKGVKFKYGKDARGTAYAIDVNHPWHKAKNEEVEQIDELNDKTLQSYKSKSQNSVEKMTKALRGREYGKVDPNKLKQRAAGIKLATAKLKKEEAEGKVAITPKEKTLAAHHGDPKRITYGDVIKARIKSGKSK